MLFPQELQEAWGFSMYVTGVHSNRTYIFHELIYLCICLFVYCDVQNASTIFWHIKIKQCFHAFPF